MLMEMMEWRWRCILFIYLTYHIFARNRTVFDTLQAVDENRRCYRLIGGVLCARTVKEVLPELRANKDQLEHMVKMGNEQLTKKGEALNKYIEENNIKFRTPDIKDDEAAAEESEEAPTTERKQLLVTN